MSFYSFKQIPIKLNNQDLIVESVELSQEIELASKFYIDNVVSPDEQPNSMWKGNLKLQYYLTGQDYLKQYIYSNEQEPISGYIGGLQFNQGYLSNYSIDIQPNSPVLVNATVQFFDQLTGTLSPTTQIVKTGLILRASDIQINNLPSYTQNILNNVIKARLDYSCKFVPSYNYYDTGITPTKADYVSFNERTMEADIISDNTNFTVPLSGEKFGIIFTFVNTQSNQLFNIVPTGSIYTGGIFYVNNYSIIQPSTLYYAEFTNSSNDISLQNPGGSPFNIPHPPHGGTLQPFTTASVNPKIIFNRE